ncbi:MAG TPA: hypothetical protein VF799_03690, partial [Geobacteraceae bacterium]
DRCLYLLRTWGAVEAEIEDADECPDATAGKGAIDPERMAAIERSITPLFRLSNAEHPAVRELMRIRIMQEARHGDC